MGALDDLVDDETGVTARCAQHDWQREGKGEEAVRSVLADAEEHARLGVAHNISIKIDVDASPSGECPARISRAPDTELTCSLLPGHECDFHWDDRGIDWRENLGVPVLIGQPDGSA